MILGAITTALVVAAVAALFLLGGERTRKRRDQAARIAEKAVKARLEKSRRDPSSSGSRKRE